MHYFDERTKKSDKRSIYYDKATIFFDIEVSYLQKSFRYSIET